MATHAAGTGAGATGAPRGGPVNSEGVGGYKRKNGPVISRALVNDTRGSGPGTAGRGWGASTRGPLAQGGKGGPGSRRRGPPGGPVAGAPFGAKSGWRRKEGTPFFERGRGGPPAGPGRDEKFRVGGKKNETSSIHISRNR